MKLKRIWDVFAKEGLYTFLYLIKDNLKQRRNEMKKYEAYQKYCEPYLNQHFLRNKNIENNLLEIFEIETGNLLEQLQQSDCAYVGFVSEEDKLAENCKRDVSCYLQYLEEKGLDCRFVYTDEDELDEQTGKRKNPKFKPDYSPDTVLSYNYIGGFWCAKREIVIEAVQRLTGDIGLRAEEVLLRVLLSIKPEQVYHLKGIYYHRVKPVIYKRQEFKKWAETKEQILTEQGIKASVICDIEEIPVQHVRYQCEEKPLVSIIIPSKDNPKLLKQCLDSIEKNTTYEHYEIVVVDNGGSEKNQIQYKSLLDQYPKACFYHYEPMEFNFSKMCNIGAHLANGEYYLFLNDDIEVLPVDGKDDDWITILLGQAMQPYIGAVGAKLLYPNTTLIQHIGIVNYESGAAHIYSKEDDKEIIKDYRNRADYNYLCVTGACLLVKAEKYHQVSGFTEDLAVTFNDVELCMKLRNAGYYQIVRNDVVLYHHESITRGEDALDEKKFRRHLREREKLFQLQPQHVKSDDFYSPLLTQKRLDGGINSDFYSVLVRLPILISEDMQNGSQEMIAKIEAVSVKETLVIRGYAYCKKDGNEKLRPKIILNGTHNRYLLEASQLYDPTMTSQEASNYNLNFAQFITVSSIEEMERGVYDILVVLEKKNEMKYLINTGKTIQL